MQRERGKKRHKSKKDKVQAVGKIGGTEAGGAGSGKGGKRKRQRGSKLSNKQEKAKGKAEEVKASELSVLRFLGMRHRLV